MNDEGPGRVVTQNFWPGQMQQLLLVLHQFETDLESQSPETMHNIVICRGFKSLPEHHIFFQRGAW